MTYHNRVLVASKAQRCPCGSSEVLREPGQMTGYVWGAHFKNDFPIILETQFQKRILDKSPRQPGQPAIERGILPWLIKMPPHRLQRPVERSARPGRPDGL